MPHCLSLGTKLRQRVEIDSYRQFVLLFYG